MNKTSKNILVMLEMAKLFAMPLQDLGDVVLIGAGYDERERALLQDAVAYESYVNHLHLEDILRIHREVSPKERDLIFQIGYMLLQAWSYRLLPILRGRAILAYLGGVSTTSLRFHVERPGQSNWLDISDQVFLQKENMTVFRITDKGIEKVAGSRSAA